MFNIKYYKLFNPDLSNLNNIQISNHWNMIGKKEGRLYSIDTFMSKYPQFNIKKYRGFNNDIKNLDDIELMVHYHLKGIHEKRIFSNPQFNDLYPNFNLNEYKNFLKNIKLPSDDDYMYKWHNEYDNFINSYNSYLNNDNISNNISNNTINNTINNTTTTIIKNNEHNNTFKENIINNNDLIEDNTEDNDQDNNEGFNEKLNNKDNLITFILVSKNINKTINTVKSLINLNIKNWNLIIISNIYKINIDDTLKNIDNSIKNKIKIIHNYVYSSLNEIIYNCIYSSLNNINTNWFSILFEGMYLNKNYLNNFYKDLMLEEKNNVDVLIYYYYINESIIIPNKNLDNIINTYIFNKNIIKNEHYLLYYLLNNLSNNLSNNLLNNNDFINNLLFKKYNVILSKYVNYFYNNNQIVLKNEIKEKKYIKFNCNNTFLDIFINLISLLNNYDKECIYLEECQEKLNILNINNVINNNVIDNNYDSINLNNYELINFNHKNIFIVKSLLNKYYINKSYNKLLNYINPLKKTILIQINDDYENYENFYVNAISFLNFIEMNIVVINNTNKTYKFINSLNPSIIIEKKDIYLFLIPFHCDYIITTYNLMICLSYYYGNSNKLFLPKNQYNNLLLYKEVIYVNNDIYINNELCNFINLYKNNKDNKKEYNNKYIYNNISTYKLYINQYIFEYFNKYNNLENNNLENSISNNSISNNNISNNIISNNTIFKKINVILCIDKNYNEKQIYNVLNQAYINYNIFLFIIDDSINIDFKNIFDNKIFYIIKNNSYNKLIQFLNIITEKDDYLCFIYNNVYLNNYNLLENINKKILNNKNKNNILFKYCNNFYHKIFFSNKNILNYIICNNILINNFNDLLNIILNKKISNSIYEICNNYVVTLDDNYFIENKNNYFVENKNNFINYHNEYTCYYENNIENKINIFFNDNSNLNKNDNLNLLLFQYYKASNFQIKNNFQMLINKLNSYNKYYIFLHNTDITLLNSYKNLFDYCKIGIILVLNNIEHCKKYEELNNILVYFINNNSNNNSISYNIYSLYNIIFKNIETYNFEYLILFNDDLKYDIDINILNNINHNNYIIIKKNLFKNYGYLDDISYKREHVMNYLMIKHSMVNNIKKDEGDIFTSFYYNKENEKYKNIFFHYIRNRYNDFSANIKTYFINLDLREDRYIHCINECNKINIRHIEKFRALKPSIDEVKACPLIDVNKMWKKDDKYLIGATGCKLSHYNILKKALLEDGDWKYILILEDDVCFDEFSYEYINLSIDYIEKHYIDFDILYLSVNLKNKNDAEKIDDSLLKIKKGLTTTGQIFQYSKLQKIIKSIERSKTEIDNTYQDLLENKYCVYPMCVYQKNFYSDINSKNMDYGDFHKIFYY